LKLNIGASHKIAGVCLQEEMKKLEKGRIYRHFETFEIIVLKHAEGSKVTAML